MKKISAVIFDVDNTLYDFTDFYAPAMTAMIDKIVEISGVDKETIISDFRSVHQKAGTSEYVFAIQELPSLVKKHPNGNIAEIYSDAIRAFRSERKKHLKLYDGVLETLKQIKGSGTRIIAYTESPGFHAMTRLKQLSLDGVIDVVYSMPDHEMPNDTDINVVRMYPENKYKFEHTEMRFTPRGVLKPNPASINAIIDDLNTDKDEILYVGDHLMKDVGMAKDVGINAAHAEYGSYMVNDNYNLLLKVTFWTDAMIEKEKKFYIDKPTAPDISLKQISELFTAYDFMPYKGTPKQHKRFETAPFCKTKRTP
jgi:phosphoglycolate phosphatase